MGNDYNKMDKSPRVKVQWKENVKKIRVMSSFKEFIEKLKKKFKDIPEQFALRSANNSRDYISAQDFFNKVLSKYKGITFEIVPIPSAINYPTISKVFVEETKEGFLEFPDDELTVSTDGGTLLSNKDTVQFNNYKDWVFDLTKSLETKFQSKETLTPFESAEKVKEKERKIKFVPCMICEGIGEGCEGCGGTREMSVSLYNYFQKKIREAARKTTLANSILEIIKTKACKNINSTCKLCKEEILSNTIIYVCKLCNDFCICEECELNKEHPHALIKIIRKENINNYKAKIESLEIDDAIEVNKETCRIFTIRNIGNCLLPSTTRLVPKDRSIENTRIVIIGQLEPGKSIDIVLRLRAGNKIGDYFQIYFLIAGRDYYIDKLIITMSVRKHIEFAEEILDICKRFRATGELSEDVEINFMRLLQTYSEDPKRILRLLKKKGNNINLIVRKLRN